MELIGVCETHLAATGSILTSQCGRSESNAIALKSPGTYYFFPQSYLRSLLRPPLDDEADAVAAVGVEEEALLADDAGLLVGVAISLEPLTH